VVPYLAAWLLFNYATFWRDGGADRHGQLIRPLRMLPNLALIDPSGSVRGARLHGKWTLVYLVRGTCDSACAENLYRMRQLRLTVGQDAPRVQRLLVVYGADPGALLSPSQLHDYAGQLVVSGALLHESTPAKRFRLGADDRPFAAHRLYLVDPLGNLMMAYAPDTRPRGITDDLKRLLKYSYIG
jgi:cytochrome oxidase Cu insertion factor (SCO1/SenC/PrrC family)